MQLPRMQPFSLDTFYVKKKILYTVQYFYFCFFAFGQSTVQCIEYCVQEQHFPGVLASCLLF